MANSDHSALPSPSPEHRRAAAGQFERANQVVATGNYDYGIRLLLSCCRLDPANLVYRQALRRTEKARYRNNLRGSWLACLTTWAPRLRVKEALRRLDYLRVLEHGEQVLVRNPWDVGTQMDMAEAADALGLLDLAAWNLEQARQKNPQHVALNRALARLYEKRGNFTQAASLWQLVRKVHPDDLEAQRKIKDLAAHETIARGHYEEAVSGSSPSLPKAPAQAPEQALPPQQPPQTAHHSPPAPSAGRPSSAKLSRPAPSTPTPVVSRLSRETSLLVAGLQTDPTNVNLYLKLAALYRRADQLEQAHAVLQEGLGPTGQAFELTLDLADLEIEPFRRNLAITEEKLKAQPEDPALRKLRIRLRKEVNTRELDLYRLKADRYPTELAHRYEVGVRLLRAGQLDEAILELQAARADPRLRCQALQYLGYCFKARNNWRLAQRNFEEALQALPAEETIRRKELLYELAQGCAEAGDLARAVDLAHDLANLDFGYRDISRLLDDWEARLNHLNGTQKNADQADRRS
jgi:tetratricopeptide (TPR) repeat protein